MSFSYSLTKMWKRVTMMDRRQKPRDTKCLPLARWPKKSFFVCISLEILYSTHQIDWFAMVYDTYLKINVSYHFLFACNCKLYFLCLLNWGDLYSCFDRTLIDSVENFNLHDTLSYLSVHKKIDFCVFFTGKKNLPWSLP